MHFLARGDVLLSNANHIGRAGCRTLRRVFHLPFARHLAGPMAPRRRSIDTRPLLAWGLACNVTPYAMSLGLRSCGALTRRPMDSFGRQRKEHG